jgi:peroxiredoxin
MFRTIFFALFVTACAAPTSQVGDPPPPAAGGGSAAELPDFTLDTIDGERFRLSDHVGKEVIVLSFWATWCMPCLAELPHLEELYQAEKAQGLVVVAVSMDEPTSVSEVGPTARRLGLTMPVVLDTEQRAVRLYNRARSAPFTVIIDRGGRIVSSSAGYAPGDEEALATQVRALLGGA